MDTSKLDALLANLEVFRDARIRERKSKVVGEFLLARKVVRQLYQGYAPEDLPFDVNRLCHDIDLERDLTVDAMSEEAVDTYRVVAGVLRLVAERHPEYFDESGFGLPYEPPKRQGRSSVPRAREPVFLVNMTSEEQRQVVAHLLAESPVGSSFSGVCEGVWPSGASGRQKAALRSFLRFLREGGYVKLGGGKTRAVKYTATGLLKSYEAAQWPSR